MDTLGWLPAQAALPYAIGFENAAGSARYTNEIRIVTQLDPDLDPRSFTFGDIRIGDISIDVPDGKTSFQAEYDFTAARGFILRVSEVLDLLRIPQCACGLFQPTDRSTGGSFKQPTDGRWPPQIA